MPPGADPLLVGERLEGRYRIGRRIGEGAYAVVHEAVAPDGRFVAVKALAKNAEEIDPSAVARFRREMKLAAELRHPNIVEVLDWGQTGDGILYLVMERLEGHPLLDVMYQEPFPEASVRHVLVGVLSALDYAHRRGFVHRDVKPSNVYLCPASSPGSAEATPSSTTPSSAAAKAKAPPEPGAVPWSLAETPPGKKDAGLYGVRLGPEKEAAPSPNDTLKDVGPFVPPQGAQVVRDPRRPPSAHDSGDGVGLLGRHEDFTLAPDARTRVKVLDFGLSKGLWGKRITFNSDLTSAGKMVGTPGYLAPEQLGDVKVTTPQMDLYAVGLLGYEMLVAAPAYQGVGVAAMFQQLTQDPRPAPDWVRTLAIFPVVEKLMARDTALRYQTAADALGDLSHLV